LGITNQYIASQAPTPAAFEDFWLMILQEQVSVIVMLTKEREGNKIKAHPYWPVEGEETYGDVTVSLLVEDMMEDFIIREFEVRGPNGQEHRTTQYQYISWPDHSVPVESNGFSQMMTFINQRHSVTNTEDHPLLVHCSAGIGRTGAFIVIHSKLNQLKEIYNQVGDKDSCDIPPISIMDNLRELRRQRHGMITRKSQYLFCYDTLLKEIQILANQESASMA